MERTTITSLRYYWDTQDASNPGWYVEAYNADGDTVDDSQKVWFPVDVDDFGKEDELRLVEALREAFPKATIE